MIKQVIIIGNILYKVCLIALSLWLKCVDNFALRPITGLPFACTYMFLSLYDIVCLANVYGNDIISKLNVVVFLYLATKLQHFFAD